MASNKTEEELAAKAAEDLAKKLKLEQPVAVKLRNLFRDIAKDVTNVYSHSGRAVDADNYRDEVHGIIKAAYRRTSDAFGSDIADHLEENAKNEKDPLVSALYLLAIQRGTSVDDEIRKFKAKKETYIRDYTNDVVPEKTDQITKTTQKNINEAIAISLAAASQTEPYPDQHGIAQMIGDHFEEANLYRGQMIAQDVTQDAAESAKLIEAEAVDEFVNEVRQQGVADIEAIKTWVTMGDDKVRETHVEADGQEQPVDQPFIVDGELLMNPGDPSLGASPGNIINCRCTAQYSYRGDVIRTVSADEDTGFFVGD